MRASRSTNGAGGSGDPNRDTWCTPRRVAEAVGAWDLDPCSNPRSVVVATRRLSLDAGEGVEVCDGLAAAPSIAPEMRTFLNPPYSRGSIARWFAAYRHTRWCFLVPFDTSRTWWTEIYRACAVLASPKGWRINFEPPPGVKRSTPTIQHCLMFARAVDVSVEVTRQFFCWRR